MILFIISCYFHEIKLAHTFIINKIATGNIDVWIFVKNKAVSLQCLNNSNN